MSMRQDPASNVTPKVALAPATISSSTTTNGAIIDLLGYNSALFVVALGTRTDGTYTVQFFEGDASNLSDGAVVTDANNYIAPGGLVLNASNQVIRVAYVPGNFRYVQMRIVSTVVTSGCTLVRADVVLGTPTQGPTA